METFEPMLKPSERKMAMDVMQSRRRTEEMRTALHRAANAMKRELVALEAAAQVEYTGWLELFKEVDGVWTCLATVDSNNLPESWDDGGEPEWDMAVPIPKPGTVSEFSGW